MKVFLKLPRGRALRLWRTRRAIDNPLLFTLADWEAELLIVAGNTGTRFVRWN